MKFYFVCLENESTNKMRWEGGGEPNRLCEDCAEVWSNPGSRTYELPLNGPAL